MQFVSQGDPYQSFLKTYGSVALHLIPFSFHRMFEVFVNLHYRKHNSQSKDSQVFIRIKVGSNKVISLETLIKNFRGPSKVPVKYQNHYRSIPSELDLCHLYKKWDIPTKVGLLLALKEAGQLEIFKGRKIDEITLEGN